MALAIAARKRVGTGDILRLGHGAFLLCWLRSLFIGLAALAFVFHGLSNHTRAYNMGIWSFPR